MYIYIYMSSSCGWLRNPVDDYYSRQHNSTVSYQLGFMVDTVEEILHQLATGNYETLSNY